MEEHKHTLHTVIIVCVAVLAVTVLLVVLFFGGSNLNEHEAITLPETSAASVEDEPEVQPDQNPFAEVTRENVQDVLSHAAIIVLSEVYHSDLLRRQLPPAAGGYLAQRRIVAR